MKKSFIQNIHWLVFGLIIVAAFFTGQALVSHYVPTALYSGPLSINSTGEAIYKSESEQEKAREKAFNDAKAKAEQMARLAGKQISKLTYMSESTQPEGFDSASMGADMAQTSPEASPGANQTQKIIVNLNYELK